MTCHECQAIITSGDLCKRCAELHDLRMRVQELESQLSTLTMDLEAEIKLRQEWEREQYDTARERNEYKRVLCIIADDAPTDGSVKFENAINYAHKFREAGINARDALNR